MTHHIDVGSVLRRTVCDLYSNLVTRPTGAAVRKEIEVVLCGLDEPSLTVIDFSQVGLLDFSCADEVVGKLLDGVRRQVIVTDAYVLVRGVRDDHLEAIEVVMQRYDMAVIVESEDGRVARGRPARRFDAPRARCRAPLRAPGAFRDCQPGGTAGLDGQPVARRPAGAETRYA